MLSSQALDGSMLRSLISIEAFKAVGLMTIKAEPVFLYINSEAQGLYLLIEVITEEFFSSRNFPVKELFEAVNTSAKFTFKDGLNILDGFEKVIPDDENYNSLESLILLLDTEPIQSLPGRLEKKLNVESYLKYSAVTELIGNWDGIVHNFHLASSTNEEVFNFVPWDFDGTFWSYKSQKFNQDLNKLFNKVISVPKYDSLYASILHELINNQFTLDDALKSIDKHKTKIREAYNKDPLFAGKNSNLEIEVNRLKNFLKNHPLHENRKDL